MSKNQATQHDSDLKQTNGQASGTCDSDASPSSDGSANGLVAPGQLDLKLTDYTSPETLQVNSDAPVERVVLNVQTNKSDLGSNFSRGKKWLILTIIFIVQTSMNFNASIYGNAVSGLNKKFGITSQEALAGQGVFLILYAFGCELWAPFSEEFGRWPIMQLSLFLVNICQIPCALAPNFATLVAFRSLGGLSSAGGSVTLGMVADLFEADEQQFAVLYVVLSSVSGSVVGPVVGGFVETYLKWQWVFWLQLIFGAVVQFLHFWFVPETRATVMLDRKAKKMRRESPQKYSNYYGPNEIKEHRLTLQEFAQVVWRPFHLLLTEPIVLCLSLISGFSDALIFTFLQCYKLVYQLWGFNAWEIGQAFDPILVGYLLAYLSFIPDILAQRKLRRKPGSENVAPERRLLALLFEAPLLPLGLLGFAFVSVGPAVLKGTNTWIAPQLFSAIIGIANFAIYYATIDYMVASYGEDYSASATGGNGFLRDLFAGLSAFYAIPLYTKIGPPHNLRNGSLVLACLAAVLTVPIYVFFAKGEWFRKHSKKAQSLIERDQEMEGSKSQQPA